MKLFFESEPKEAYAEFFTNIDLVQAKMEFREKDPEYRVPLVAAPDGGERWVNARSV
jgi:lipocalin